MKILGLIPARGGSKGIPNKNIKLINGKPLLCYTAEAALESKKIDKVVLSTDSEKIRKVGISCGLEVPFIRPSILAEDDTPTLPVIVSFPFPFESNTSIERISPPTSVQASPVTTPILFSSSISP